MTERPIIFSTPMVVAILAGRKAQTRRVIVPQPERRLEKTAGALTWRYTDREGIDPKSPHFRAPCQVGDTLWVRETFSLSPDGPIYRASGSDAGMLEPGDRIVWRPSIHMPRWAARLFLRVTDVRVERLQDISEADAIAEGRSLTRDDPRGYFPETWDSLNARRGYGWDANPWLWVISFERIDE